MTAEVFGFDGRQPNVADLEFHCASLTSVDKLPADALALTLRDYGYRVYFRQCRGLSMQTRAAYRFSCAIPGYEEVCYGLSDGRG